MKTFAYAATAALLSCAGAAQAATVVVTPSDMAGWSAPASETGAGASATITGTAPRSGNGSYELKGTRTRVVYGALYENAFAPTLSALSDVQSLTFDWQVAADSAPDVNSLYTPALRLILGNGVGKKELIWEGVYNNTYNTTTKGSWYTSGAADSFYLTGGTGNDGQALSAWATDARLAGYRVIGLSVGNGGGVGDGFHGYADNVTFTTKSGSTTYNFELSSAPAVPEPGTWALMILGFGTVGFAMRRRKAGESARAAA
jgi:hypothetical protein